MSECVVCGAMPSRLHQRSVAVLVCEKHKDHGESPSELDSLRSRLADAERERDGLRGVLGKVEAALADTVCHVRDRDPAKPGYVAALREARSILARPVTITRISHPESNARPADAGEESNG